MLRELARIRDNIQDHKYFGNALTRRILPALENEKGKPPSERQWKLLRALGHVELISGNERDGLQHYGQAVEVGQKLEYQWPRGMLQDSIYALAICYLRMGETENCCARNGPESCLFPIPPSAVHSDETGSRKAIRSLEQYLQFGQDPVRRKKVQWLLNIAYMTLGEYPDKVPPKYLIEPKRFRSDEEFPRFANVAADSGLNTYSLSGGAIADDFDRDGDLDLMVSNWYSGGQMRFFTNDGEGKFADRTSEAGLDGLLGGLNMVQADFNNDGFIDVYVVRGAWQGPKGKHPNSLLRNNGDGTFTDVTFAAGLGENNLPTQTASWGDYDLDGDVDLYVGSEPLAMRGEDFKKTATACQLFRNNGDETFLNVAEPSGVTNLRFTKGVIWGDYNNDRWPDIYVSNLGDDNRLYHNNGDGTFRDVAPELDVVRPNTGIAVWFWDFDNDGLLDLYVSAYAAGVNDVLDFFVGNTVMVEPARLYRGTGTGFTEVGEAANLVRPCSTMGSNFGDLNHDGYLDFYLGTGSPPIEQIMPNVMYLNKSGKRFADVTTAGGFGNLQKGHAVTFADLDRDGDQDVFQQMGGAYPGDKFYDVLYQNPGFGNNWVSIHLVGVESNRSAIGARIKANITDAGKQRTVYKHVNSGGSFGGNPLTQMIGLGKARVIERLEIHWPKTDATQLFKNVPVNSRLRITESQDTYESLE